MNKFKILLLIIVLTFVPKAMLFAEIETEYIQAPYYKDNLKDIISDEVSERSKWVLRRGTWFLKKGEFYSEVYSKFYWHNQEFGSDGKKRRWAYDGKGREKEVEFKLEHGLTDKHTFMVYLNFKEAYWKDSFKSRSTSGPVYARPGLKYLLFEDPFIAYLQFKMKFPLGFDEQATPSLGSHQIDGEIKLLTAQPWPELPGYTKLELGFRGRNEEPANEVIYFAQFAYNIAENILLEFSLDGQEGLAQTGGVDEDWTKFTFGPVFKIGLVDFKFGYGKIFAGKNTSAADEVYSAIYGWW